ALGWALYNCYLAGTTGQSTGKKIAGIRLVRELDGQLVGGGLAIGRYFVHILDSLPCLLGFLWPLWDAKKQTFADKILKTLVIKA
ncbi:MAG: RDD family protein, partial [Actinomycetota bacterium]|nr:RDD family protein [Actinomycetota bacterium]